MAELYPVGLNDCFNRASYNYQFDDNVLRSEISVGPNKVRRRYTKRKDTMQGTVRMQKTELDLFFAFYENTLKDGTLTFLFPKPEEKTIDLEVRFTAPPSYTAIGFQTYDVVYGLEVIND